MLLIMCGDTELNPGPTGARQTRLTTAGQVIDPDEIRKELGGLQNRLERLENQQLRDKVENLEAQSRRDNLMFYNLPEEQHETWEQTETKVRQHVKEQLGIEEVVEIERAHRLGRRARRATSTEGESAPRPRPVIVKFSRYKELVLQEVVLQKARDLAKGQSRQSDAEGTMPVNVVEDYTQRVREERKRLVPHMLELRRSQPTVKTYLKYDKLVSGRDTFTLDENNRLMKVGNGSS